MNLRQRIRPVKISPQPWKHYRGEIRLLPVSAQCLFANRGLPWDILETELRGEGWLSDNENIWGIISTDSGLKRTLDGSHGLEGPFDDTWTDEDYENYYRSLDNGYKNRSPICKLTRGDT